MKNVQVAQGGALGDVRARVRKGVETSPFQRQLD